MMAGKSEWGSFARIAVPSLGASAMSRQPGDGRGWVLTFHISTAASFVQSLCVLPMSQGTRCVFWQTTEKPLRPSCSTAAEPQNGHGSSSSFSGSGFMGGGLSFDSDISSSSASFAAVASESLWIVALKNGHQQKSGVKACQDARSSVEGMALTLAGSAFNYRLFGLGHNRSEGVRAALRPSADAHRSCRRCADTWTISAASFCDLLRSV